MQIEYIKLNKSLSLVNIFFLGRSGELNKTFAHRPLPTPSAEAPGGGVVLFANPMPLNQQTAPPWWWCLGDGGLLSSAVNAYYSYVKSS